MNVKALTLRTLAALLISAVPTTTTTVSTAVAISAQSAGTGGAMLVPRSSASSISQDTIYTFQLGAYSYELRRVGEYSYSRECYGHQAKHAETVMENIERFCGPVTYPAREPAGMILREGNYFDCGREQLRVDVVDEGDAGQRCAVRFINADGKVWINGGGEVVVRRRGGVMLVGVGIVLAGLAVL